MVISTSAVAEGFEQADLPTPERLTKGVELALKAAGLLAAFGYMSLRAHWNYLGVSPPSTLEPQRYLMEIYQIAGLTLGRLAIFGPLAMVLGSLVWPRLRSSRLGIFFRARLGSTQRIVPVAVFGAIGILSICVLLLLSSCGEEIAVGHLHLISAHRGAAWLLFCLLIATLIAAYRIFSRRSEYSGFGQIFWSTFAIAAVAGGVEIAWLLGIPLHDYHYPRVSLVLLDKTQITGLLLLRSGEETLIWRADCAEGQSLTIPKSQLGRLVVGRTEDLLQDIDAAVNSSTQPPCTKPPNKVKN